jgi:hypothetical protein
MFTSKSLKVTFVTIIASFALLLGMFASTGIASAHTNGQATDAGKSRHCKLLISEQVEFVPTFYTYNPFFYNGYIGNNWWQNRNQHYTFWNNNSNFDYNMWDFTNFGGFYQFQNQGHFILVVTQTRVCNGHNYGQHTYQWQTY